MNERRGYFILAAVVLLIDQATKWAAHAFLRDSGAVEVIPNLFNLWYSRNPGGLFGYFRDWAAPGRILLLTLMPVIAIVFIGLFLGRSKEESRSTLVGLGLILGGAAGNLIDRIVRGEVIDFLDVYAAPSRFADWLVTWFGTAHWPTFNVADSAIVVGAGLLLLNILRPHHLTPSDDPTLRPDAANTREPV